jgi:hypothetical protein
MRAAYPDIRRPITPRAIERRLLRLKWLASAVRFEIAMRRHARAMKYGFNPDQPRVPRGNPDGGEWTDGNDGRVRVTASDTPRLGSKLAIAVELARQAIKFFRDQNLLNNLFGQKEGTVTYTKLDDLAVFGVNSDSPESQNNCAARSSRSILMRWPPKTRAGCRTTRSFMPKRPCFCVRQEPTEAL